MTDSTRLEGGSHPPKREVTIEDLPNALSRERFYNSLPVIKERPSAHDLRNVVFHDLEPIELAKGVNTPKLWRCRCRCGALRVVRVHDLLTGDVKRCRVCQSSKIAKYYRFKGKDISAKQAVTLAYQEYQKGKSTIQLGAMYGVTPSGIAVAFHKEGFKTRPAGHRTKGENGLSRGALQLEGQVFGELTVIKPTEKRRQGTVVWQCRCSCGKLCERSSVHLTRGHATRCKECKVTKSNLPVKVRENLIQMKKDGLSFRKMADIYQPRRSPGWFRLQFKRIKAEQAET